MPSPTRWPCTHGRPTDAGRPIHDDPAVVAATHATARDGGRLTFTAGLVADEVHWAGGLSGVAPATAASWPGWTVLDPWHRLGPSRLLTVGAGVLRASTLPASPGHQRRGGAPWPAGSFAE